VDERLRELDELARTFLDAMRLSLTARVSEDDESFTVDLEGADSYLLLERKARVLDALQMILGKVAQRRLGLEKRVVVDCEGHRLGRRRELEQIALNAAEKARKMREPVELAPMNSYERRIVHLALKEAGDVETASLGDGFLKSVVIKPV